MKDRPVVEAARPEESANPELWEGYSVPGGVWTQTNKGWIMVPVAEYNALINTKTEEL